MDARVADTFPVLVSNARHRMPTNASISHLLLTSVLNHRVSHRTNQWHIIAFIKHTLNRNPVLFDDNLFMKFDSRAKKFPAAKIFPPP